MFLSYQQALQRSLDHRKGVADPAMDWLVPGVVAGLALSILLAVQVGPAQRPEHHFADERGLITVLSALFLAMAGGFAGACVLLERSETRGSRAWWILSACACWFLSLDELLEVHEKLGDVISGTALGPATVFRNWNDVVVMGYGVVAILALVYFLPAIVRLPRVAELLASAFGFYVIHTLIDSTQDRTSLSIILEESAKLFSSAFCALAMLFRLLASVDSIGPPETR